MKAIILIIGVPNLLIGLRSIIKRKVTTYAGIAETRTVFTNIAAVFWGICLVLLSSGLLMWVVTPQYFQHPIFTFGNLVLAYLGLFILSYVIQLVQNVLSRFKP